MYIILKVRVNSCLIMCYSKHCFDFKIMKYSRINSLHWWKIALINFDFKSKTEIHFFGYLFTFVKPSLQFHLFCYLRSLLISETFFSPLSLLFWPNLFVSHLHSLCSATFGPTHMITLWFTSKPTHLLKIWRGILCLKLRTVTLFAISTWLSECSFSFVSHLKTRIGCRYCIVEGRDKSLLSCAILSWSK